MTSRLGFGAGGRPWLFPEEGETQAASERLHPPPAGREFGGGGGGGADRPEQEAAAKKERQQQQQRHLPTPAAAATTTPPKRRQHTPSAKEGRKDGAEAHQQGEGRRAGGRL